MGLLAFLVSLRCSYLLYYFLMLANKFMYVVAYSNTHSVFHSFWGLEVVKAGLGFPWRLLWGRITPQSSSGQSWQKSSPCSSEINSELCLQSPGQEGDFRQSARTRLLSIGREGSDIDLCCTLMVRSKSQVVPLTLKRKRVCHLVNLWSLEVMLPHLLVLSFRII